MEVLHLCICSFTKCLSDTIFNLRYQILLTYVGVFGILFCMSFFGSQYGLRKFYTKVLLKIFKFSSAQIEHKRKKIFSDSRSDSFEDETDYELVNISPDPKESCVTCIFSDIFPLISDGIDSIVEDAVTPQFTSEELPYWNLLSRTNRSYGFVSLRLTLFWFFGFIIRYFLLLPLRSLIFICGMLTFLLAALVIGCFPDGPLKKRMNLLICVSSFDFLAGCLSLVATFHHTENIPKYGIAVANHTSPVDPIILATNNYYDMVGQKHGGFMGMFMKLMSRTSSHIWFERSEAKDRSLVSQRLRAHATNRELPPILIFPEGVCVNNTTVMQFKKGAFEACDEITPIAIKFDARFGDAFWWQDYFVFYLLCMMTSWAIVVDVWYLPPMKRLTDENSTDFANRVKSVIAAKAGLSDSSWDGFLKAVPIKDDAKKKCQQIFAQKLIERNFGELDAVNE